MRSMVVLAAALVNDTKRTVNRALNRDRSRQDINQGSRPAIQPADLSQPHAETRPLCQPTRSAFSLPQFVHRLGRTDTRPEPSSPALERIETLRRGPYGLHGL